MKEQQQHVITPENLKQMIEGSDDLSLAKELAHGVIETLSDATHQMTVLLWEGLPNAQGILSELDDIATCVIHDMSMFQKHARNFEAFCEKVREDIRKGDTE